MIRIIKSRRIRWVGHVARIGEKMNAYRILVGKPEEKRPLGKTKRRWVGHRLYSLVVRVPGLIPGATRFYEK
jgi:hypothetical protein